MNKPRLIPKAAQKLLLTPQIRQAITLLELPLQKLKVYLEQEVANNPLLQSSKEDLLASLQGKAMYNLSTPIPTSTSYEENESFLLAQTDKVPSLHDYLSQQLRISNLNAEELAIAEEIISCIDNYGYLRISPESLSERLNSPIERISDVLSIIKNLDPSGVGAKDLQECLLIQLKNKGKTQSPSYQILDRCFKELTKKKYGLIAKKIKITEAEVQSAIAEIKRLNPRPGSNFSQEVSIRVTPDVVINKKKGKIEITLNQKTLPRIQINNSYREILRDSEVSNETKQFVKKYLCNALWLIKAANQRNQNILKVVREIVKIQKRALFQDVSLARPLTLKDIAQKTDLHLSTVGRIVMNKYASTPQGTIRLKELFSAEYHSQNGVSISGKNIAAKIKNITVSSTNPLTDQKIADMLQKEGICISRRTVAKYRNKLRIPPSFFR